MKYKHELQKSLFTALKRYANKSKKAVPQVMETIYNLVLFEKTSAAMAEAMKSVGITPKKRIMSRFVDQYINEEKQTKETFTEFITKHPELLTYKAKREMASYQRDKKKGTYKYGCTKI